MLDEATADAMQTLALTNAKFAGGVGNYVRALRLATPQQVKEETGFDIGDLRDVVFASQAHDDAFSKEFEAYFEALIGQLRPHISPPAKQERLRWLSRAAASLTGRRE